MDLSRRQTSISLFIINIILIALFNLSMCWLPGCASWHKLFVAMISFVGIVAIPLLSYFSKTINSIFSKIFQSFIALFENIKNNFKRIILLLVIAATGYICIFIITKIVSGLSVEASSNIFNSWQYIFFCGCYTLALAFLVCIKNHRANLKVEILFVAISLIIGLTTILSSPKYICITPDDDTHWARTASLVSVFDFVKYDSENIMFFYYGDNVTEVQDGTFEYESMCEKGQGLNSFYGKNHASLAQVLNNDDLTGYDTQLGSYVFAYVAPAVFMILAKGLHLSYTGIFIAGKLGILLAYTAIIYFAIKRLKYGKILMSLVALSPTTLFLANSYSYDWWVTSWILLAYSIFISELQQPEKSVSNRSLIAMFFFLGLGIIPKWIYIVLALPFLFLPKEKFTDKRQRRIFYIVIALLIVMAFVVLVCPVLLKGLGQGDLRGGFGINASAQMAFILSNPFRFLKVLVSFFIGYINPMNSSEYLTCLGYFGQTNLGPMTFVIIVLTAFIDRNYEKNKYSRIPLIRIIDILTVFAGISAVITVFYLIYTPVLATTVLGCQARYIIPFLFPFMYFIGVDGSAIVKKINKNYFALMACFGIAAIYMYTYWSVYIFKL